NSEPPKRVSKAECVKTEGQGTHKLHQYNITHLDGIGQLIPIGHAFNMHCEALDCALCEATNCTETAFSPCPVYTTANATIECASLTCDGDRFSVNGRTFVGAATCARTGWTI
ncbi:hypothetical protein PMAYCL1PPCAC_21277, partial [Pristionchus mayeri]